MLSRFQERNVERSRERKEEAEKKKRKETKQMADFILCLCHFSSEENDMPQLGGLSVVVDAWFRCWC